MQIPRAVDLFGHAFAHPAGVLVPWGTAILTEGPSDTSLLPIQSRSERRECLGWASPDGPGATCWKNWDWSKKKNRKGRSSWQRSY